MFDVFRHVKQIAVVCARSQMMIQEQNGSQLSCNQGLSSRNPSVCTCKRYHCKQGKSRHSKKAHDYGTWYATLEVLATTLQYYGTRSKAPLWGPKRGTKRVHFRLCRVVHPWIRRLFLVLAVRVARRRRLFSLSFSARIQSCTSVGWWGRIVGVGCSRTLASRWLLADYSCRDHASNWTRDIVCFVECF